MNDELQVILDLSDNTGADEAFSHFAKDFAQEAAQRRNGETEVWGLDAEDRSI